MRKEHKETVFIVAITLIALCLASVFSDEIVLWLIDLQGRTSFPFIGIPR
jgi:hypothetical protein